jgi:hypothetical protein
MCDLDRRAFARAQTAAQLHHRLWHGTHPRVPMCVQLVGFRPV